MERVRGPFKVSILNYWVNEDIYQDAVVALVLFIKYFQFSPILLGHMLGLHSLASFCLLISLMLVKGYELPIIR